MSESSSLVKIDAGDFTKPANTLIEKISNAIGILYEPTRIKRAAKAEVEAKKIIAMGDIEVTETQQRGLTRLIQEEGKNQQNIELITAQAISGIEESAKPENIEDDWIAHFFDKCRIVSDTEMQSLWSSLLAGEANKPGSYSKRTIDLISTLDKSDANLFTNLCRFAITEERESKTFPLILDFGASIYAKRKIDFESLTHLASIGLITFNASDGLVFDCSPHRELNCSYFNLTMIFSLQNDSDNSLPVGHVFLTKAGEQLAPICGALMIREFLDYIIKFYKKQKVIVEVKRASNA